MFREATKRNNTMRGPSGVAAAVLSVLLFVTVFPSSICFSSESNEPSDHPLRSSKCSYLEMNEGQFNAFIVDRLECCMCPKGYKYVGICNSTHPNTTLCEPCEDGTHQHWGPHVQKKCTEKKEIDCPALMIYDAGTATEEDRCVCQPGTKREGKWCVPTSTTSKVTKPEQTTMASVVSLQTKRLSLTNAIGNGKQKSSEKKLSTLVNRITSTVTSQDSVSTKANKMFDDPTTKQTADSLTENSTRNPKDNQDDSHLAVKVGIPVSVLGVVVLCLGFIVWRKRNAGPRQNPRHTDSKDDGSVYDDTTPDTSRSALVPGEHERDIHSAPANEPQYPLLPHGTNPGQGDNVQADHVQLRFEQPEITLSAGPVQYSPAQRSNRVESSHQVGNPHQQQQQVIVQRAPHDDTEVGRNKKFALNVATAFGDRGFPKNEAKRLARALIDNPEAADSDLDEIEERYKNNAKEMIYKFMELVIQIKGRALTPEYLLQKVKDTRLQTFVEIVEDKIANLYMQNQDPNA